MKKWTVTVVETVTKYIDVEAPSKKLACEEAENASDSDFYGHEFEEVKATKVEEIQ